jgi:hypothetical protein
MTNLSLAAKHISTKNVSFLSQVYIFSVVLESLLFFIIGSQTSTGFSFTIGKMLQFFVFLLLIVELTGHRGDLNVVNIWHPFYRYFAVFFLLAILAAIIGIINGGYTLNTKYNAVYADTILARIVRSSSFRPALEYIIILYYFFYFAVLPKYLIPNKAALFFFFKYFKLAFLGCLALGFTDLFFQLGGIYILPRDMWEGRMVGFRFHGLAGEPRDAFVYLFFAFGMLNIREYFFNNRFLDKKWFIVTVVAALLTQSGSGLIGIVFAVAIFLLNNLGVITLKKIMAVLGVLILSVGVIGVSIYTSQRLQDYLEVSSVVFDNLKAGNPPPPLFAPQMVNIFPVWDLFTKIVNGNFLPVLFGSGFGSASVVNNNMGKGLWNELTNPHSQLIRLLYECGLIGTAIYIKSFIYPIKRMTSKLPKSVKQNFLILTIVLVGLNLSHRSTTMFIYLGIFITTFVIMDRERLIKEG